MFLMGQYWSCLKGSSMTDDWTQAPAAMSCVTSNWGEYLKTGRARLPFRKTGEMGLKQFNKGKYHVLYLGQGMSLQGADWLDWWQLCRTCGFPLTGSWAWVSSASLQQKVNDILHCISKRRSRKSKKPVIPLHSKYTRDVIKCRQPSKHQVIWSRSRRTWPMSRG